MWERIKFIEATQWLLLTDEKSKWLLLSKSDKAKASMQEIKILAYELVNTFLLEEIPPPEGALDKKRRNELAFYALDPEKQLEIAFRVENDGVHLSEERQNQVAFEILKETLLAEAKVLAEKISISTDNAKDFIAKKILLSLDAMKW